ncbi:MAG: NfeD family protein [Gammaproteobacteria bacterium]|nr:NfeD family protein [Gammaproteobacteria bacterium]NKB63948.1 NfeD family protein [Gammaproteobacteria bacterium]
MDFSLSYWWWLAAGLIMLTIELLAPFAFFLWLGVSALVTAFLVMTIPELPWQMQALIFSILSVISIVISRRFTTRKTSDSELPNLNRRASQYVGRTAPLYDPIVNGIGKISIDDSQWQVEGPELERDSVVKIVGVNGSVLIVEAVSRAGK